MSIVVTCDRCGARFQTKDEHAGKQAKCPKCQTIMTVPGPAAPAANPVSTTRPVLPPRPAPAASAKPMPAAQVPKDPAARATPVQRRAVPQASQAVGAERMATSPPQKLLPAQLSSAILGAFRGPIEPIRLASTYWLSAALVSAGMVMLPLVYVGLVVLAAYLVYYHAVHDLFLMKLDIGRARLFAVMAYLGPILAGLIMIVFMIKPLFSRSAYGDYGRSLTRHSDPLLFAFVERVCEAIGAPRPARIDVDCQVNASAHFRRGFLSMLNDDLVLTIGVPLVAGLTLDQFAGVLAHEFGHFTQRTGMRLSYLIRSINGWFTQVVYERDTWDQALSSISESLDVRLSWVFYLAQLFVWLTRRILWVLMMIGHMLAGLLVRQMEYDADRHEIRLVGSGAFESTVHRLARLDVACDAVFNRLLEAHHFGMLVDDLPRMTVATVPRIPKGVENLLNQSIERKRTGLLDTHPSNRDRIQVARQEDAPGVYHFEAPATVLFDAFPVLCKNVTLDFYRAVFGPYFQATDMQPVERILAKMDGQP